MMKILKALILSVFVTTMSCAQNEISTVDFLIGTWQIEGKQSFETWKMDRGNLTGESYQVRENEKYVSETLKITAVNNNIIYTATVKNQNNGEGILFTLMKVKNKLYSFENMKHDFPSKIQYEILSETELKVNVLGKDGKGFSYKLIKQD